MLEKFGGGQGSGISADRNDALGIIKLFDNTYVCKFFLVNRFAENHRQQFVLVNNNYPLAEFFDIVHIVGSQNNCRIESAVVLLDKIPHFLLHNHIQSDGGLIQKQDFWGVNQGGNKLHFHSLSEREFSDLDF